MLANLQRTDLRHNSYLRWLGSICLVAIGLRLVWIGLVAHIPIAPNDATDQASIYAMGEKISRGQGLDNWYYPPLYPLLLGIWLLIRRALMLSFIPVRVFMGVIHIGITVGVIVATAELGRRRFSHRVGLLAAGLLAVWPNSVIGVGVLMTEQLATPLFMLGVVIVLWSRSYSSRRLGFAGLIFGLAILARPALTPIIIAVPILLLTQRRNARHLGRCLAYFLVAMLCVLLPWLSYTYAQTGEITLGTAGGFNLCLGNNDTGYVSWSQESVTRYCPNPQNPQDDRALYRSAARWMLEHPWQQPVRIMKRAFDLSFGDFSNADLYPTADQWQVRGMPQMVFFITALAWWTAMLIWAIAGLVRLNDRILKWAVVILSSSAIAIPLVSVATNRYHDILIPVMALLVASGSLRAGTRRERALKRFSTTRLTLAISG